MTNKPNKVNQLPINRRHMKEQIEHLLIERKTDVSEGRYHIKRVYEYTLKLLHVWNRLKMLIM